MENDVIALGELLIDFTENDTSSQGNPMFEANPGGAPCNVLAMLNNLGHKTAFLGKVGEDQFGVLLKETLNSLGIDTSYLYMDKEVRTTLAFVHTAPDGDRDFAFYRNPGADMMLTEDEVKEEMIKKYKIFHYGTLSMTHEGVRKATYKGIQIAKDNNLILSFDPNLRRPLWNALEDAKEQILYGLGQCDVLKISDEEILFVSDKETIEEGVAWIRNQFQNIKLLLATLGKEGSIAYYKDMKVTGKPFLNPDTIETTGAGDTFCGCVLHYILTNGLQDLTEDKLSDMLRFANAASSLITTRRGALKVMPTTKEIETYLADIKR
ncbi:MAG: carbohydrate kinase [Lachnospiraceae bacterium]|nr:carbohydrate kinase [Lachnospiraceae bacterium]